MEALASSGPLVVAVLAAALAVTATAISVILAYVWLAVSPRHR